MEIYENTDQLTIKDIFDEVLSKTGYINSIREEKQGRQDKKYRRTFKQYNRS